ncbi:PIG-L deacetylase family protein [Ilumatobacter sp.]|uniref:PIG-L deacetylase family protein n=1 Tax=Ilumatobacter sp. TaxID=1967498 RepID=UPI003C4A00EA
MTQQLPEMPNDFERVLAVVAHPDDLEYGASGAIAVWTDAGTTVSYVLVSHGEAGIDGLHPSECGPLREAEQIAAAKCVGVDVVEFLDHRDGVIEHTVELRRDIAGAIRRHRPEVVVVINFEDTWFGQHWNSPDHRSTGRATLDAIGDAGNRWIFPEQITDGLEPWGGVRMVAVSGSSTPTHAVAIENGLERAIASLEAHAAYLDALSGDMADARSFLTDMATSAGERLGGRPAALFHVIGA